jgi:hypothetical protein
MKNGRAGADEATKMVYGAKPKATVKRTKEQEMVTEAAEYTEVATEEQKSSKTDRESTAKQQQHTGSNRKSASGGGRESNGSNATERRRDVIGGQG